MKEPAYTLEALKKLACKNGIGYQRFDVDFNSRTLHPHDKHKVKYDLLYDYMQRVIPGQTVIDLGCDKGFYSVMAYQAGATSVLSNEKNAKLTNYRKLLFKCLHYPATHSEENYFADMSKPVPKADCVLALSVLHEIKHVSLDDKIRRIREMSRHRSLIEFCEDYQERFGDWWNIDTFVEIVQRHYSELNLIAKYDAIGGASGTRYIYDCCG